MGMGLAISRNIINSAGGDINYQTEIGKGTVFVVELPLLID
jgi:signal transduction histidine kinase